METEEKKIQTDVEHKNEEWEKQDSENDDWENRVLCSDGNCIGVIGPDGRCKECGKPFQETEPSEAAISKNATLSPTAQAETAEADLELKNPDLENDDWENRVLCNDESCIGVIGPDGHCKECGKPFQSE